MQLSEQDRLTVARLSAITHRQCRTGAIADDARAIAELAAEAAGRADLLAHHAGIMLGTAETAEGWDRIVLGLRGELAIGAGADPALIPAARQLGRERAEAARHKVPPT